ncbi:MAG: DUF4129 domain-containing protein [Planctomycetes bacterium]|nr:DUF4129 domain-containing protein [Planctomycetota bacterium]
MTARPARRLTLQHGKVAACFGLSLAAGHAVSTLYALPGDGREALVSGVQLAVLYAAALWAGHRFRHAVEEGLDLFAESNAHLFLGGFVVIGEALVLATAALGGTPEWIAITAPGFVVLQGLLAVGVGTRRGADRLAANALVMVVLAAVCSHPGAPAYACAVLSCSLAALVFEHFDRVVTVWQLDDRPHPALAAHAAQCALVLAGGAGALFLLLNAVVPVSHFKAGDEYRFLRLHRARIERGWSRERNDATGDVGGDAAWAEYLKSGVNAALVVVGLGLAWLGLRALLPRAGRARRGAEEESLSPDEIDVPLEDTRVHRARQTWIKTPRILVIDLYLALAERLRKYGISRMPSASPAEFAAQVLAAAPEAAEAVAELTETYRRATYAPWEVTRREVEEVAAATARIERAVRERVEGAATA